MSKIQRIEKIEKIMIVTSLLQYTYKYRKFEKF